MSLTEVERQLRHMHVHFARGVWRWLRGDDWYAQVHFEMAASHLDLARLEPLPPRPERAATSTRG